MKLESMKTGLDQRYGALSVLNQAIPFICKKLEEEFGKEHVFYCTGRDTARIRRSYGYHKTKDNQLHEVDAWCIGMLSLGTEPEALPDFSRTHWIRQFRRQDRSLIRAQVERTYRSQLEVTKSYRRYNDPDRLMPGAVFLFRGKRYVLQGRITNGAYFKAVGEPKMNIPARDCRILKQNEDLVFFT